jgi:DNA-binding MarR family transcriptional regulator
MSVAQASGAPGSPERGADDALWLTAQEQQAWRSFLYGINRLLDEISGVLEQDPEIDLSLDEYEILVRLSESGNGQMRMSDLADRVVHSRSRLTHTVARLEKRGIVQRVRCSADGRGREAHLTDAGYALLEKAAPVHVRSVREQLLDVIGTEDLLRLGEIMGRTLPEGAPVKLGTTAGSSSADVED